MFSRFGDAQTGHNETIFFISELLVQIPNSNLTEGPTNLKTHDFQPHFDQAEIAITGYPTDVAAPFGNGLYVATADQVLYEFPVSEPWPCPFNISECPTGVIVSFWFRRNYEESSIQKHFVRFGNVFRVYASQNHKNSVITMRWSPEGNGNWYGYMPIPSGEWNIVAWVMNDTHTVGYLNGTRRRTVPKGNANSTVNINNVLYLNGPERFQRGNFSMGPIRIWAGRVSPVYIWQLFQEILPDQDKNWSSFRNDRKIQGISYISAKITERPGDQHRCSM